MDFQSAMETFAEAWVAANAKSRPDVSDSAQREGSVERSTNGRAHDETLCKEEKPHIANGSSPGRESPASVAREPSPRPLSNNSVKAIPLHIVVETVALYSSGTDSDLRGRIEIDSYTLIPMQARFADLLQITLGKTGLLEELPHARGFLQLRNWRPLPLENIPETDDKTVSEVLAEVASFATLIIRVYSSNKVRSSRDIKDRLLRLLLSQSHHLLVSAGCPLDEGLLTALLRGTADLPEEACRQFEAWWAIQIAHHVPRPPNAPAHMLSSPRHNHIAPPSAPLALEKISSEPVHPALQSVSQFTSQKTRMRTSFDQEYELPRLHRWFSENQHPTRLQIQQYVAELNSLESRRGRKPLDANNVVYWFKNARAAYKRQEFRSLNGLRTPPSDEASVSDVEDTPPESYTAAPPTPVSRDSPHRSHRDEGPDEDSRNRDVHPPNIRSESVPPDSLERQSHAESDVDMSDEDDCRSRDSGHTGEGKNSPPMVSGALSLPPYPPIPGLGQGIERLPYPVVPGSLFQHSMMYMAQYMPQISPFSGSLASSIPEERRKRNRTFIDPVTEVPRLEQWFALNTHPSHNLILKYTDELNRMPYRQKFPKLEPKNVQFWFKNRRAKCKRLRVSL